MIAQQTDIFGNSTPIGYQLQPHELPKAVNDWAFCIQILLLYKKPVDYFTIVKEFGIIKFQTRIAEILTVYPHLIEITEGTSRKRLGRVVAVSKYFIKDKAAAIELYMTVFNKKRVFCELYNRKKTKGE
ncbi:MAG TPA: hypothetical protein VFM18_03050 [Methanosarcina sp.]|nr:hypothetical protein [Methanosarcina sp.]